MSGLDVDGIENTTQISQRSHWVSFHAMMPNIVDSSIRFFWSVSSSDTRGTEFIWNHPKNGNNEFLRIKTIHHIVCFII